MDVYARARVRYDEILQSLQIIESLAAIPVETRCVREDMTYDLAGFMLFRIPERGLAGGSLPCCPDR